MIHNSAEHHDYAYASVSVYFTDIDDLDDEDLYVFQFRRQQLDIIPLKDHKSKLLVLPIRTTRANTR